MVGILDRVGQGLGAVSNFVQRPEVTGILGALATGFNPAIGLLAGPGIANSRERKALENDALREQISNSQFQRQQAQAAQSAASAIPNALLGSPISQIDPSQLPGNVQGTTIGADRIGRGLLGQIGADQQRSILGAVAQGNPQGLLSAVTQSRFPQPTRNTTADRLAAFREITGRDPTEQEFLERFLPNSNGMTPAQQAQFAKTQLEIIRLQRELANDKREADNEIATNRVTFSSVLDSGRNLVDLSRALEGTEVQPGSGFANLVRAGSGMAGRIASAFGADEFAEARQINVDNFDTLKKEAGDFILQMTRQLEAAGVGATNPIFRVLEESQVSTKVSPVAIRRVVKDVMSMTLDLADAGQLEIADRDTWERFVKKLGDETRIRTPAQSKTFDQAFSSLQGKAERAGMSVADFARGLQSRGQDFADQLGVDLQDSFDDLKGIGLDVIDTGGQALEFAGDAASAVVDTVRERAPGALSDARALGSRAVDSARQLGARAAELGGTLIDNATTPSFSSASEVDDAFRSGSIEAGDRVRVGNETFVYEPDAIDLIMKQLGRVF